jgi:aspartate racemase
MDERNAIGVVGGLGPYAGLDLVKKIFDNTVASTDQEHLPVAMISYPGHVPDRSTYIADPSKPNPVPALAEVLRRLDAAGCSVAGMPCNTAHAPVIFDVLQETMEREGRAIRLLNMIEACAAMAPRRGAHIRRVGVLATNSSLQSRLHSDALEAVGLEGARPDWGFQNEVINPVIFDETWGLKAQSDPPTERARTHLIAGIRHLRERGADAVVLGCTELPLAIPEPEFEGVPLIDSTETLARALIRATHPDKLLPLADAVEEKAETAARIIPQR